MYIMRVIIIQYIFYLNAFGNNMYMCTSLIPCNLFLTF